MIENQINKLLRDVVIDRDRIKQSIFNVLNLFYLSPNDITLSRAVLNPSKIYVSATEECNVEKAKKLSQTKYKNQLPAPITLIEHNNKRVIFIGSNRSIIFTLKDKDPDCIIVKLPDSMPVPVMIVEAKQTLEEII